MESKEKWLSNSWLTDEQKKELQMLNKEELADCLSNKLSFGTGGMRGIFGPGPNRMNKLTIARITAGFGKYLQKRNNENLVIIGYDNRSYSEEFAEIAAEILSGLGISVEIFPNLIPTPIVSFSIRARHATGGIMITASHNPPEYNGFKVYDETGCQLLPDEIEKLKKFLSLFQNSFKFSMSKSSISTAPCDILRSYSTSLKQNFNFKTKNISIGYSPLHGTGLIPMQTVFKYFNFENFNVLECQASPDSEFSETKSSNPEDPLAFEKLIALGKKEKYDLLLATDPDADRLGAYYRDEIGCYHRLSGNQIGAIFTKFLITKECAINNKFIVTTVVSSGLGAEIARSKGIKVLEVLTGFKYIGDIINKNNENDFLLGYEESFGFLFNPLCRDKDGIQAGLLLSFIADTLKNEKKNLGDYLEEIYQEYGYYEESQILIESHINNRINQEEMLLKLSQQIVKNCLYYEDYEKGYREYSSGKIIKLQLPLEKGLKSVYKDNSWICIRPSGTEPKIKVYFGIKTSFKDSDSIIRLKDKVKNLLEN